MVKGIHYVLHKPTPVETELSKLSPAERTSRTYGKNKKRVVKHCILLKTEENTDNVIRSMYIFFLTHFKKVEHCSLPPEMYFDNFQADGKKRKFYQPLWGECDILTS